MKDANVYEYELDTYDFFDTVVGCNEDTEEWKDFLEGVAEHAAEHGDSIIFTEFEDFMKRKGYANKIADVLCDAAKAFVNERINDTKADFDYC